MYSGCMASLLILQLLASLYPQAIVDIIYSNLKIKMFVFYAICVNHTIHVWYVHSMKCFTICI